MKLHCNVEVYNRTLSWVSQRKSQRSVLTIGRQSNKNDLYIVLQTLQNQIGTKYKICDNIEKVFTKFTDDGKATIRLKEPAHDLVIRSETIQLKSFLRALKLGLHQNDHSSFPVISNIKLKNNSLTRSNKLIIMKNSDYPTLKGFPKTIEELSIVGLRKKSFDRQILNLKLLRVLNLSDNEISYLPKEIGCLPHLQELFVAQNQLGKSQSNWKWITQPAIKKNLRLLDIRDNKISELPVQIGTLDALVKLQLCQNLLKSLPQSIGRLRNLKYLQVASNHLSNLPGSMKHLKLLYLDLSQNPFDTDRGFYKCEMHEVPSLVECAAAAFLKTRIPYDASVIPRTLIRYLDNATYCYVCGNACFSNYKLTYREIPLGHISSQIKISMDQIILFECYTCSNKCADYRYLI